MPTVSDYSEEKPGTAMERVTRQFNAIKLKYPLVLASVMGYACLEESGAMP
jgi:hypothetical protein